MFAWGGCGCERERERESYTGIGAVLSAICGIMHYPCYCLNCPSFLKAVHDICDTLRVNACGILAVVASWVKQT